MRTDEVTRGNDKRAHLEEEVPELSMRSSNLEKRTLRIAVALSKQPARAHRIKKTTPKTPEAAKIP
jgi:hypothetical protein